MWELLLRRVVADWSLSILACIVALNRLSKSHQGHQYARLGAWLGLGALKQLTVTVAS